MSSSPSHAGPSATERPRERVSELPNLIIALCNNCAVHDKTGAGSGRLEAPSGRGDDGVGEADVFVEALLTASRVLVGLSVRSLAEAEDTVTLTQFRTLVVLSGHDALTLAGVAGLLGVNASTAQRQVDRLVGLGLVSRVENPADRRQVRIALTAAGATIVQDVTQRRRTAIAAVVSRMGERHRRTLVRALQEFTDAAGEPQASLAGTLGSSW